MKNRIIKFRVWNTEGKCFYTDSFVKSNLFNLIERTNEPIMQFTGLTDKNEKEIYEGDIIKRVDDGYEPRIVNWSNNGSCFVVNDLDRKYLDWLSGYRGASFEGSPRVKCPPIEVIGNCYENPVLLK